MEFVDFPNQHLGGGGLVLLLRSFSVACRLSGEPVVDGVSCF
jgi:hypothetical protein